MRLIRGNVERVAAGEAQAAKLKKEGFVELPLPGQKTNGPAELPAPEKMKLEELRKLAEEKEIPGCRSMNKAELLKALKDVE